MSLKDKVKNLNWIEKYRPQTLDDLVVPEDLITLFNKILTGENNLNFIFYGPPGTGKTSTALLLVKSLNAEYKYINASSSGENGVASIRDIADFMSFKPMTGMYPIKFVILDECDFLSANAFAALRGTMEKNVSHVRFILTCNYINKIPEANKTRPAMLEFGKWKDKDKAIKKFTKKNIEILKKEGVEIRNIKSSLKYFENFLPNFRLSINEIEKAYLIKGYIDFDELIQTTEFQMKNSLKELIQMYNSKKILFNDFRKWVETNKDLFGMLDSLEPFYDTIFNNIESFFRLDEYIAEAILIIHKYVVQDKTVLNKILSVTACLTELALLKVEENNK